MSIIIKSTRIKTKSGPGKIIKHLLDKPEENEDIQILQGDRERMREAFDSARHKTKPATYALRHWIISSTEEMTEEQLKETVSKIALEFGFNEDDATLVMHQKQRDGEDISDKHYHLCVPEILENGRVMTNQKNYAKHEKICRELEHNFGFTHITGKHNRAVEYATKDLNPEVSEIAKELAKEPLPNARFSAKKYQEAKRSDVDIKALTRQAKEQCNDISNLTSIQTRLNTLGLRIQEGTKERKNGGFTPVIATEDGFILGSVGGILKRSALEIDEIANALKADREGMHDKAVLKPVESHQVEKSPDPQTDHEGMREPPITWLDKLEKRQEQLKSIFDAPHPRLVEESGLDKAERVKLYIAREVEEMRGLKEKYNKTKEEYNEFKANASIWNKNGKRADAKKEEMDEQFEEIARLAVYIAELIMYKLGIIKEEPNREYLLTQKSREEILDKYYKDEISKIATYNNKYRDKGIVDIAKAKSKADNLVILKWKERDEAREALNEYNNLSSIKKLMDRREFTTEEKDMVEKKIGEGDFKSGLEVLEGYLERRADEFLASREQEEKTHKEPETPEIYNAGRPKRRAQTLGM